MSKEQQLLEQASSRFIRSAGFDPAVLEFLPEVRGMCADNRCGSLGKNWACPPGCGTLEECESRARKYTRGVLVQTVGELEDSFDFEGMTESGNRHKDAFTAYAAIAREICGDVLPMGAGPCKDCESCAYPEPCRSPERSYPSMEANGLFVSRICKACGLSYHSGPDTVTYTSCVLFNEL